MSPAPLHPWEPIGFPLVRRTCPSFRPRLRHTSPPSFSPPASSPFPLATPLLLVDLVFFYSDAWLPVCSIGYFSKGMTHNLPLFPWFQHFNLSSCFLDHPFNRSRFIVWLDESLFRLFFPWIPLIEMILSPPAIFASPPVGRFPTSLPPSQPSTFGECPRLPTPPPSNPTQLFCLSRPSKGASLITFQMAPVPLTCFLIQHSQHIFFSELRNYDPPLSHTTHSTLSPHLPPVRTVQDL